MSQIAKLFAKKGFSVVRCTYCTYLWSVYYEYYRVYCVKKHQASSRSLSDCPERNPLILVKQHRFAKGIYLCVQSVWESCKR